MDCLLQQVKTHSLSSTLSSMTADVARNLQHYPPKQIPNDVGSRLHVCTACIDAVASYMGSYLVFSGGYVWDTCDNIPMFISDRFRGIPPKTLDRVDAAFLSIRRCLMIIRNNRCWLVSERLDTHPLGSSHIRYFGITGIDKVDLVLVGFKFYIAKQRYDYEKDDIQLLFRLFREKQGGVLGDEVGLKKQLMTFITGMIPAEKIQMALIVTSNRSGDAWKTEFQKCTQGISRHSFSGFGTLL